MSKNVPWKEAVIRVLRKSGDAMHYTDIAEAIQSLGLRKNFGSFPHKTVSRIITVSMNEEGQRSPFERVEPGRYRLVEKAIPTAPPKKSNEAVNFNPEVLDAGAVQAFGILWRRDWINWKKKALLGSQIEGSDSVNFAEQVGVYILYDRDKAIYVGLAASESLFQRLLSHTKGRFSSRWDRFSWFGFREVSDSGELNTIEHHFEITAIVEAMEAVLIETLEPPQNRKGGQNFVGVEFLQSRDKDVSKRELQKLLDEHLSD